MAYHQLANAATSSGPTAAYEWFGGPGFIFVDGIGTGAVTMQASLNNATWVTLSQHNSTAAAAFASGENGAIKFSLSGPAWLRADITTGSSTGMNIYVQS